MVNDIRRIDAGYVWSTKNQTMFSTTHYIRQWFQLYPDEAAAREMAAEVPYVKRIAMPIRERKAARSRPADPWEERKRADLEREASEAGRDAR